MQRRTPASPPVHPERELMCASSAFAKGPTTLPPRLPPPNHSATVQLRSNASASCVVSPSQVDILPRSSASKQVPGLAARVLPPCRSIALFLGMLASRRVIPPARGQRNTLPNIQTLIPHPVPPIPIRMLEPQMVIRAHLLGQHILCQAKEQKSALYSHRKEIQIGITLRHDREKNERKNSPSSIQTGLE